MYVEMSILATEAAIGYRDEHSNCRKTSKKPLNIEMSILATEVPIGYREQWK